MTKRLHMLHDCDSAGVSIWAETDRLSVQSKEPKPKYFWGRKCITATAHVQTTVVAHLSNSESTARKKNLVLHLFTWCKQGIHL